MPENWTYVLKSGFVALVPDVMWGGYVGKNSALGPGPFFLAYFMGLKSKWRQATYEIV